LSAGDDRSIKIWNYKRFNERFWMFPGRTKGGLTLVTALQIEGAVHGITFAPDARGFYAAGTAAQIAYFPKTRYSRSAILAETKRIVNRNMFAAEWARFTIADELGSGKYQKTFEDLPDLSIQ